MAGTREESVEERTCMVAMIIAIVALCGAFVGTYLQTGSIWDAMLAGGTVILIYLLGLLVSSARALQTVRGRVITLALGLTLIAGVTSHWLILRRTTNWQYENRHVIRKVIEHGSLQSSMHERSIAAFAAYSRQSPGKSLPLSTIFNERNPRIDSSTGLVDTLWEGLKVYAVPVADSEVVVIGVGSFTKGEDAAFTNYDGRKGILQSRVRLSTKGVDYEIQN
jgi:hypothetical protein